MGGQTKRLKMLETHLAVFRIASCIQLRRKLCRFIVSRTAFCVRYIAICIKLQSARYWPILKRNSQHRDFSGVDFLNQ